MIKNPLRVSLVLLAGFALICGTLGSPKAQAQVLYGSVVGEVTDATGGAVPNAKVTLTNTENGGSRDATTDGGGRYSFVNVLPGKYTVKVVATGFRTFAQTAFDVGPNTVGRIDAKLEVGQMAEQVTVQGEAVALQTEKADTHSQIDTKTITSLPLSGYRNYQSLINLVPGATPAVLQNSITDTPGRALQTHINGGNAQTNITRIDGATSVNVWLPHHVGYVTPEENVEVVNITTGAADRRAGAGRRLLHHAGDEVGYE
jgi:Cna protein B-type domain.